MKKYQTRYLIFNLLIFTVIISCTELAIEKTDVFVGQSSQEVEDPAIILDKLYDLAMGQPGDPSNAFAFNFGTTNEQFPRTHGTELGDDNGWRKLHQGEWGIEEKASGNSFETWHSNQILASQILDPRNAASTEVAAQALFLRAWFMFLTLDHYGQVPFREAQLSASEHTRVLRGPEAVGFILADLDSAIKELPATPAGSQKLNLASKAAARMLKAKVLINRHVFENQLTGLNRTPGYADMLEVIDLVDAIEKDGFALQQGYLNRFEYSVDPETIWFITTGNAGSQNFSGLLYRSSAQSGAGWNGFSTLADFYDLFEGDPDNKDFTAGDQALGLGNIERHARIEFNEDSTAFIGGKKLNIPIMRFSDAYLMKAEAVMRIGGNATALINNLRTLRGSSYVENVSERELMDERGRELYLEGWRRNDMIRFGFYGRLPDSESAVKTKNDLRELFPIPLPQLLANPNLQQNPGY